MQQNQFENNYTWGPFHKHELLLVHHFLRATGLNKSFFKISPKLNLTFLDNGQIQGQLFNAVNLSFVTLGPFSLLLTNKKTFVLPFNNSSCKDEIRLKKTCFNNLILLLS